MAQLQKCWHDIQQRGVGNLFGLHWDEIDIRSGVKLCRRAGQIIGLEDFTLPTELESDTPFEINNHLPEDSHFPEDTK